MAMNLIQLYDDLKTIPIVDLMKYAQGSNPQVPAYMALGELNSRKQMEQISNQFSAAVPTGTIKDNLTQGIAGVNPAAQVQGVNPIAPQQAQMPQQMAQPEFAAAEGGLTALMPYGGLPNNSSDVIDPSDIPQYSSPLERARGGLESVPVNGMFRESSFAGGGIVAFAGNDDQPVDADMPATDPEAVSQALIDAMANTPTPRAIEGSETAAATTSDANPPKTPGGSTSSAQAPRKEQAGSPFAPGYERPAVLSDDELIARNKAMREKMGISSDPYAEVKAEQKAMRARQEKEMSGNALDRVIAGLTAIGKADPTKGAFSAMGAGAEASQALKKEQDIYRDKMDQANLAFKQSMAKEEDALKRGDLASVVAERQNQQKAQHDYEQSRVALLNAQSSRISAGASAQNAATQALSQKSLQALQEAQIQNFKTEAEIKQQKADADLLKLFNTGDTKLQDAERRASEALSRRPEFKETVEKLKTMVPGSPAYNAYSQYISDVRQEETNALLERRPPKNIAPPVITPEERGLFGGVKNPETADYKPFEHSKVDQSGKSDILPLPTDKKDMVYGARYKLNDGGIGVWNGKKLLRM